MSVPLIGIPAEHVSPDGAMIGLSVTYSRAIEQAGGAPALIPLLEDERLLRAICQWLDGVLLAGGGDVAAECYGAPDSGRLTYVDRVRDRVELLICRSALAEGLPVLAICRGIQVLNVAAGGTLIQDIPSEVPLALEHRSVGPDRATRLAHTVEVQPNTLLANALGLEGGDGAARSLPVNSTHHQAVAALGDGLAVSARAPDGVIEGIERLDRGRGFVLGVQWHPERLVPGDARMVSLFRRFVDACRDLDSRSRTGPPGDGSAR
ncbi:MAG: gamma-glutamyl-gamma-aminobutyrate hydrolase family protein [Chloroflexi bacterium]|nr:gamma-glutamyl-gamma-aminobutyrate hydrolase family protein [Chloroflexota bacterium]